VRAPIAEATGNVIGDRQSALDDLVALTAVCGRTFIERRQAAKHVGEIGVLRGSIFRHAKWPLSGCLCGDAARI
jgi:hypothetical protein